MTEVAVTIYTPQALAARGIMSTDALRVTDGLTIHIPDGGQAADPSEDHAACVAAIHAAVLAASPAIGLTLWADWDTTSGRGWLYVDGREVGRIDAIVDDAMAVVNALTA